jgi:mono/diheme cytochrome c family protein/glucose/arabinose dehydrogenase
MASSTWKTRHWSIVVAIVAGATGFGLAAQAPTAPPPATPVTTPAPGQGAPDPAAGRAGGGGRGRGGPETLPGGPQLTDPAYADYDFSKRAPLLPLTPEQQLQKFILQPGYRLELALADPDIEEPSAVYFDGNGRMFVLEIRGYMQDADATGQLDPVGRISRHVDTDGDGVYDQHTIFVDNLIFPRFATPFGPDTLIVKESNSQDVWKYTDANGDGVAERRELFDTGYGRLGNVEHQESHLTWALDNWMYSTFNSFRARWTPHGVIKEPIGSGGAQWGVVQDNDGKVWFQGGASGLPGYWQFPILYGNFGGGRGAAAVNGIAPMDPDLSIPWGAPIRIADMQGGLSATRMPDGSLRGTTAGAGNDIVRGHRMPADLQGDYLYGEVVARIVRRVTAQNREGLTTIRNAYDGNEFIKSTDPYFRPVDMTTAPDGTVYITDMYRGIIQEATWSGPGTYLRARIEQYDLDKVVRRGRIWRLVYDGVKLDRSDALPRDATMPRMHEETAAQLVAHLAHPNGWWRDTAQQLLVLRRDTSVVPLLQERLRTSTNLLEKFHTMWTLEGLDALDASTVRREMQHPEARMRIQAIRASETLYKGGDRSFAADYRRLASDADVNVTIQALLTMNKWRVPEAADTIRTVAAARREAGVQLVATTILNPPAANAGRGGPGRGGAPVFSAEEQAVLARGQQIYGELCFTCHGDDGYGAPRAGDTSGATMAPRLAGSPRVNGHRDYVIKAVLHGVTGPVDGETFQEVMIPSLAQPDDWVAAVVSYVRNSFGNAGGFVNAADVRRVRAATSARKSMWTVPELVASLPALVINDGSWKVSASHNAAAAAQGLSMTSWSSQAAQAPGMWFQIELPQQISLTEIQFTSTAGGRGGGGGRGAGGAPPVVGFPRGYKVESSMNGTTWVSAAEGTGTGPTTVITFRPVPARFVRITQTATPTDGTPVWSIQQLRLYAAPAVAR